MGVVIVYPIDIIERKSSAQADDSSNVTGIKAEARHEFLDISPVSWHRAAREPTPQGLVDGEYVNPLRFGPLKPQQFPISMLQYHAYAPFPNWAHYTKQIALRAQFFLCLPSFVHCPAIRKNENGPIRKNEKAQKGENNRLLQRVAGTRRT